jgi:hypothetical protein
MRQLVLIIGTFFIALNTIVGLVLDNYATLNFLLVDISIALSIGIIYFTLCTKIANGFKIGLINLFILIGIIRSLCFAFTPTRWENNYLLIAAISIFLFEIICVSTVCILYNKKQ